MATTERLPLQAEIAESMEAINKAIELAVEAVIPVEYPVGLIARRVFDEASDEVPSFEELGRLMAFAIGAKSRLEEATRHVDELREHLEELLSLGSDVACGEARAS